MSNRSETHTSGATARSNLSQLVIMVIVCAVVGAVFYIGSRQIDFRPAKSAPALDEPFPKKYPVSEKWRFDPDVEPGVKESPLKEPERTSPTGAHRARLIAARAKMDQATQRVTQLQAELIRWRTGYEPLTTNDPGRRLAADSAAMDLAESVWGHTRPDDDQVVAWRNQLAAWQDDLDADVFDSDAMNQVATIVEAARKAAVELDTDRLLFDSLLEQTKSKEPGSRTFQEVLIDRRVAVAAPREQAVRQAAQEVRDQHTAALQKLNAELAEKETAVEKLSIQNASRRLDDKLLLLAEEGKADAQAAQRAREKLQLVKSFERDLPQVKQYLVPFLTDGFKHRENAGGTKGPASYNKLVGQGVMDPTRQGMESFIMMATQQNDRPAGAFPIYHRLDHEWATYPKAAVEKAQALLTKYGPLMVELKMLAE